MIKLKNFLFLILIFFSLTSLCYSKIILKIVMKINNEIVTSYDIEKEANYLMALNDQLREINDDQLKKIAKRSITKEIIRKNELLKYKELDFENTDIDQVLLSLARIQHKIYSTAQDDLMHLAPLLGNQACGTVHKMLAR